MLHRNNKLIIYKEINILILYYSLKKKLKRFVTIKSKVKDNIKVSEMIKESKTHAEERGLILIKMIYLRKIRRFFTIL